jgi:hypothetical protein
MQAPQGRDVYDRWIQLLREQCSAEGDDQDAEGPAVRAKLLRVASETASQAEAPKTGGFMSAIGRKNSGRARVVGDGADGESTATDYVKGRVSVVSEGWLYKKGHKRTNWTR